MTYALVSLARTMNLAPAAAIALPTVITVSAGKAGMSEAAFVAEAMGNAPLREYLAGICGNVMAEVA